MSHLLISLAIVASGKGQGSECNSIRELITQISDLSEEVAQDCLQAVEHIQWALDRYESPEPDASRAYMAYTWPLLISKGYLELLGQRRPEALIIFAHYAVILHYGRHMWLVGQAGHHIISLITKALGPEWQPWLVWPNKAIQSKTQPTTLNTNMES